MVESPRSRVLPRSLSTGASEQVKVNGQRPTIDQSPSDLGRVQELQNDFTAELEQKCKAIQQRMKDCTPKSPQGTTGDMTLKHRWPSRANARTTEKSRAAPVRSAPPVPPKPSVSGLLAHRYDKHTPTDVRSSHTQLLSAPSLSTQTQTTMDTPITTSYQGPTLHQSTATHVSTPRSHAPLRPSNTCATELSTEPVTGEFTPNVSCSSVD